MEIAYWIGTESLNVPPGAGRVYVGDECSSARLPDRSRIAALALVLREQQQALTLVTSVIAEREFDGVCAVIEYASNHSDSLEVVCNDWGLVHWLAENRVAEPVVGRLLAGQAVDPRLASLDVPELQIPHEREVLHEDGTRVLLRYRRPGELLRAQSRRCAIDVPELLSHLAEFGARRCELSNLLQGVAVTLDEGWSASLHAGDVPVAIARERTFEGAAVWHHPTFPVPLHRRGAAVYYANDTLPDPLPACIDRLVYRAI